MFLVGIAGGTGSGKTTFVRKIKEYLPDGLVTMLSQDSYYLDNSHISPDLRRDINFDHPSAIDFNLLEEHLIRLKNGKSINQPVYSFLSCTRKKGRITIKPGKVVILEGILIFFPESLRKLFDIRIFLDADEKDRIDRIISRDMLERGRTRTEVMERFEKTVKPMHLKYIEPAMSHADIIIPKGCDEMLAIHILEILIDQRSTI